MSLLQERIEVMYQDLTADPPRISAYHNLPFVIFRYDPIEEYLGRKQMGLLATRLENDGHRVHFVSLARLMWKTINSTKGTGRILQVEEAFGFDLAQRTVSSLLSRVEAQALPTMVAEEAQKLNPNTDIIFLVRAAALAPAIYQLSKLLDELKDRFSIPVILFYPGGLDGNTGLKFMDMTEREAIGNYRVKIY